MPEPEVIQMKPILSTTDTQTDPERVKTPIPLPVKPTLVEYWAQTDDANPAPVKITMFDSAN
jgi:hypothetical protein